MFRLFDKLQLYFAERQILKQVAMLQETEDRGVESKTSFLGFDNFQEWQFENPRVRFKIFRAKLKIWLKDRLKTMFEKLNHRTGL